MFNPLKLGSLTLASNIVQGPLAGYSSAPFRELTYRYGKPGFTCTEMNSANALIHRQGAPKRYTWRDPREGPLCYQLSGADPLILAKASRLVSNMGADLIDLNAGCPVRKIRQKKSGSKLLQDPALVYRLIAAIKMNSSVPVSIKVRVAAPMHDHNTRELIDAVEQAGVDFIVVHGRHWTERYDVPSCFDAIAEIVKLSKVPVIANGDVACYDSLKTLIEKTACQGVMISRASVGNPWLFQQLREAHENRPIFKPDNALVGEIFMEHIQGLIRLDGEKLAVLNARKLAKYYAKYLSEDSRAFILAAQEAEDFAALRAISKFYFSR